MVWQTLIEQWEIHGHLIRERRKGAPCVIATFHSFDIRFGFVWDALSLETHLSCMCE